jgi:hypothetical protein
LGEEFYSKILDVFIESAVKQRTSLSEMKGKRGGGREEKRRQVEGVWRRPTKQSLHPKIPSFGSWFGAHPDRT